MAEVIPARRRLPRIEARAFAGPASFVGQFDRPLKLAHLTDQHVGLVTPISAQWRSVELVNAAKPDLVCITGDFVCHTQKYLEDLSELIRAFDAPVFCVLGNHDHWAGGAEVERALLKGGASGSARG